MSLIDGLDPAECDAVPAPERMNDCDRWYVVMTQAGRELFAAQNLINQHFHTFLPRMPTTYRTGRRIATKLSPLFPQYLFVQINPARQRWRSVNGTLGVRRLLAGTDGPQAIGQELIDALMAYCDKHDVVQPHTHSLKPGDSVKLIAGPLAGIVGTLLSLTSSGRVKLLLEMMNGQVAVNSDVESIVFAPRELRGNFGTRDPKSSLPRSG